MFHSRVFALLLLAACQASAADTLAIDQPPTPAATTVPLPVYQASGMAMMQEPSAPWSLTASDGSGLALTRVDAKAVFQGPLAFTELHLWFHNPEDRTREGTFAIALPAHAAVSRFAMETTPGQFMEAEVVEKKIARRAYEDFLHRRQDPALLEKAEGNQFTARVFPIPAKGDKHIVLSFSQELPGERYVLPLRGLPRTDRIDVELATYGADGKHTAQQLTKRGWQPDADFVSSAPVAVEAVAAGAQIAAQVQVGEAAPAGIAAADPPTSLTLLVDTSASRTLGFAAGIDALDKMIAGIRTRYGATMPLQVVAFDQDTQAIYDGPASGWGATGKAALLARGAAGASDLGQALTWLSQAGHAPKSRVAVVTDGVVTAGAEQAAIAAQLKGLRGVERVDFVLAGGIRDDAMASALARASARPGAVLDLETGADAVTAGLGEKVLVDVAIDIPGATWVYPRKLPAVRAGSRVMVYAQMKAPARTVEAVVAGQRRTIAVASGTDALVDRAVASAHIAELEGQLATLSAAPDKAAALKAEIAKRSVAARVVSSQTSMLVLESDADYARYGIARTALADILAVEGGTVVQKHRTTVIAAPVDQIAKTTADTTKGMKDGKAAPKKAELAAKEDKSTGADEGDDGDEDEKPKKKSREVSDRNRDVGGRPDARIASASAGSAAMPPPPPPPPPPSPRPTSPASASVALDGRAPAAEVVMRPPATRQQIANNVEAWPPPGSPAPLKGELANIMSAIARKDLTGALATARAWHTKEPVDVLALIGLGEALEANRDLAGAARMYGSIIDLFPSRADLRRFAGERLERVAKAVTTSRDLAIDTYKRAVADRPDHLTGHRLLAYALERAGKHAEAFAAILAGLEQKYPEGRFRGGERVLREDAGLIGASYAAAAPSKRAEIEAALAKHQAKLAEAPSTRFILYWETDANDVDFHIQDAKGGHAWYSSKELPSGGALYEDVTTGYGPECFAIPGVPKAGPYRLSINYYSQGPMGYGMGLLEIMKHDGKGGLAFEDRPYIIMADHAYVDLGTY